MQWGELNGQSVYVQSWDEHRAALMITAAVQVSGAQVRLSSDAKVRLGLYSGRWVTNPESSRAGAERQHRFSEFLFLVLLQYHSVTGWEAVGRSLGEGLVQQPDYTSGVGWYENEASLPFICKPLFPQWDCVIWHWQLGYGKLAFLFFCPLHKLNK